MDPVTYQPPARPLPIAAITVRDLDIALREPFGIATGVQPAARNLLVRVELDDGTVGWGEAAPFEAVNGETRERARAAIEAAIPALLGWDARTWTSPGHFVKEVASARCAVETAVLDALCRACGVPMWVFFGGISPVLFTDYTITTGTPDAAAKTAAWIYASAFRTIKLKVGGVPLADDVARVQAVVGAAPRCWLLLDANGAMEGVDAALGLLAAARSAGGNVVLFEQPLGADDLRGMREVAERGGVRVAADESAGSVADVQRIAREGAAQVVNLKPMKSGLVEALHMAHAARGLGLELMIGGMVESPLAATVAASLACGVGIFEFVDLDTPLFMKDIPLRGGADRLGPEISLAGITAGHGVEPRAESPEVAAPRASSAAGT